MFQKCSCQLGLFQNTVCSARTIKDIPEFSCTRTPSLVRFLIRWHPSHYNCHLWRDRALRSILKYQKPACASSRGARGAFVVGRQPEVYVQRLLTTLPGEVYAASRRVFFSPAAAAASRFRCCLRAAPEHGLLCFFCCLRDAHRHAVLPARRTDCHQGRRVAPGLTPYR